MNEYEERAGRVKLDDMRRSMMAGGSLRAGMADNVNYPIGQTAMNAASLQKDPMLMRQTRELNSHLDVISGALASLDAVYSRLMDPEPEPPSGCESARREQSPTLQGELHRLIDKSASLANMAQRLAERFNRGV